MAGMIQGAVAPVGTAPKVQAADEAGAAAATLPVAAGVEEDGDKAPREVVEEGDER